MNVYVVFVDDPGPFFLKILASGFRHCFMAVTYDDKHWVIIDHLYPYTALKVLTPDEIQVEVDKWIENGYTVLNTKLNDVINENAHFGMLTCVETTKRILKLNVWWIQTPWQLYWYITNNFPHVVMNEVKKKDANPELCEDIVR